MFVIGGKGAAHRNMWCEKLKFCIPIKDDV